MKKIFLNILFLTILSNSVLAQLRPMPKNLPRYDNEKMHFGFTLGISYLQFNLK